MNNNFAELSSNDYLELVNQLKKQFDENERKNKIYKEKYNTLHKACCMVYGLIRTFLNNEFDSSFEFLLDECRSILSFHLFSHLENEDE